MALTRAEYLTRAIEFAARGVQLKNTKLDDTKVRWIRRNSEGHTAKEQANVLGVHYRTVEKVKHYETWGHVRDIT